MSMSQTNKGRHGILVDVTSPLISPPVSGPQSKGAVKKVLLLKPRGFCAGVVRAIDVVNIALDTFGAPIYVRKEIVHNRFVVNELAEKGASTTFPRECGSFTALMGFRRQSARAVSRAN
jgi:4-hydroxy-3-methylbut-2-enyl diphosphate reductase